MGVFARFRSPLAGLLLVASLISAFGLIGTVSAAEDPPVEAGQETPGEAPEQESEELSEETAPGGKPTSKSLSEATLEKLLMADWSTILAMVLLKYVPLAIGVLLLFLWWVKRTRIFAGDLPPPAPVEPTLIYGVLGSFGLLLLATQLLPPLFFSMFHAGIPGTDAPLWMTILAVFLGTVPITYFVLARRRRIGRATAEELAALYPVDTPHPSPAPGPRRAFGLGWWGFCVATALVIPSAALWALLLDRLGVDAGAQALVSRVVLPGPTYEPILIAVFGIFVAPLTEETLFRGMLYPAVRRAFGGGSRAVWISATLVSVLFAAVHGSALAFVPLFVLAMFLAWLMETTNSLAACVLVHAIHNATTLLPLLLVRFS